MNSGYGTNGLPHVSYNLILNFNLTLEFSRKLNDNSQQNLTKLVFRTFRLRNPDKTIVLLFLLCIFTSFENFLINTVVREHPNEN